MASIAHAPAFDASVPVNLGTSEFARNKFDWYRWMLEEAPVCPGRVSFLKLNLVSRYDDCRMVLTDERFVRNRGRAKGTKSGPFPFPLPKSVAALTRSMILEDDPTHRRLRNLVNRAFTPRAVGRLADRVAEIAQERLEALRGEGSVDLLGAYARPIPTRVIAEMMGVPREDARRFHETLSALTKGLTGFRVVRTMLWDLRGTARFVRDLIARKRSAPGDDILTALIEAEEGGDRLSEDELVAMVFLLIVAGFETTLHAIVNGVRVLIEHPDQVDRLRAEPDLWESAVQEIMRHRGPVQGTKLMYATETLSLHGVTIEKGSAIMPMLGAANHDPRAFERPDDFDIARSPNHHLGFGLGPHFCLGRQLALMETRIALETLFDSCPNLALAVDPRELELAPAPGWHRHVSLPMTLGRHV